MPKEGGHRETPMFVTIAGPNNLSMVKVSAQGDESFDDDDEFPFRQGGDGGARKGGRGQSARQLSWSILLRALNVFGCLSSLASHVASLCCAARRRVASGRTDSDLDADSRPAAGRSRFYSCIKVFLWLSIVMLAFEVAAYYKGWHIGAAELGDWRLRAEELRRLVEPYSSLHVGDELRRIVEPYSSFDVQGQLRRIVRLYSSLDLHGVFGAAYAAWVTFRVLYIAPQLQLLANACIVLFIIQTVDRVALCLGCFWVKLRGIKPIPEHNSDDLESGGYYPMVLIQIPMCNEKEVYQQSIGAVCNLDWPSENMLVQVLDDSDDPITQTLIREEVEKWKKEGVKIVYHHRVLREGYKAGNLKNAMSCAYVKDYEFVVIFDADFQPASDYLKRTMPHFKGNEELGLVQARWSFVNKDENLLTRLQNINLCFHFEVEQQVNGVYLNFFGFNGTAGVWRKKALEDSGGWLERTTVEDMDIAVRAHLNGWKFIFLNDVECQCELPESYEAYRKQQHRWHSGPMQLFRLCFMDIIRSKIGFWKKFNLIFLFFLLRKLILPFYSFTLFCIILPLTMFVPESNLPAWVVCYIPATMSLLNILPSPRSFPFIVPYLLFENTMSVTKFNAMISGLFQLGSAYKWEVTKKSGRSSEGDLMSLIEKEPKQQRGSSEPNLEALSKKEAQPKKASKRKHNRIYLKELSLAFLLLTAAARSLLSEQGIHFYFLLFQGVSFLLVGLDLIGEQID